MDSIKDQFILVSNPGSSSRKYSLYKGRECLLNLHFEHEHKQIIYTASINGERQPSKSVNISHIAFSATKLPKILNEHFGNDFHKQIKMVALRIVAPSSFFQQDRLLDRETITKLSSIESRAPLHINGALQEITLLNEVFSDCTLAGISDSAFHASMPAFTHLYDIPLETAYQHDVKRFGYHGLSVQSAVEKLKEAKLLPKRLIVCHLGSGASVTAVHRGRSFDTTMGYSPLEGLMMATRSGSLDITAVQVLQVKLKLDNLKLQQYLNYKCGLLGVSGHSPDIRELLKLDRCGDQRAALALDMYVYRIQQAVAQMAVGLSGLDALVFTGTVGERSSPIRRRVIEHLLFLGLQLDPHANHRKHTGSVVRLSRSRSPVKIYIVPADEDRVIIERAGKLLNS